MRRRSANCSTSSTCPATLRAACPTRSRAGSASASASPARSHPVTRDALGTRIRELHDRLGLTTILVTHDMAEALLLADRVLVMKAGRIVADATPADLVAGKGGDDAQALVQVPRAQAERLQALVA